MKTSYILGIYGVICLIFVLVFSGDVSKVQTQMLPGSGGIFGPIVVKEKKSSYEIGVSNRVALNKWSFVEVKVLDANKKYLYGFGDGMWHESGRDSDGYWEESKTKYTMDVTFKDLGEYYLDVASERNDGVGNSINVSAVKERGSNILFLTIGVISLIGAGLAYYFGDLTGSSRSTKGGLKEPIKNKSKIILIVVLVVVFLWALFYSMRGYGYMGHNGYHHGPSFFYWGGPRVYHDRSNRDGSISGSGHRGGGLSGGK